MEQNASDSELFRNKYGIPLQFCPKCEFIFGALPGGRDAVCTNCGYKDPCCE